MEGATSSGPEREPRVLDGVIDEHVYCAACGYDLYGSHVGRCPECGAVGAYRWPTVRRPLAPFWRRAAIGLPVIGLLVWLAFYSVLWTCGSRLMDLWGRGVVRPVQPSAKAFIRVATTLLGLEYLWALVAIAFAIAIGAFALVRRDRKSASLAAVAVVLAGICGFVTWCANLVLAGV